VLLAVKIYAMNNKPLFTMCPGEMRLFFHK